MKILAIESSCDETAVAIMEARNGEFSVLSNVVFSQIDIHQKYGGVVPEIASRHHIEKITYVLEEALTDAKVWYQDIDLVACTATPGLVGSLMVGVNAAKTISLAFDKPLVMVNHIHGHIYANRLVSEFTFPVLALVVSGGHTELILMKDHFEFEKLGETLDDAVGEAYDKVARVVEVGYPGGPIIDKMAKLGKPVYPLPHIHLGKDSYDFSFSGLKSAVINLNHKLIQNGETVNKNDLAASFQNAVIDVLCEKTLRAAREFGAKHIIVAGGVAANSSLRETLTEKVKELPGVRLSFPPFKYCTDNAAMIAVAGYYQAKKEKLINNN